MKKKILLSILVLFVCSVFLIRVNAASIQVPPLADFDWSTKAKAPSGSVSSSNVYATVTDGFDFSFVEFETTEGNNTTLSGKESLKKIIVGNLKKSEITNNKAAAKDLDDLFTDWWTAYCLDSNMKYPEYGVFNFGGYRNDETHLGNGYSQGVIPLEGNNGGNYSADANKDALNRAIVLAILLNNTTFADISNDLVKQFSNPAAINMIGSADPVGSENTYPGIKLVVITQGKDIEDFYRYFMKEEGAEEVKVGLAYIGFTDSAQANGKKVFYVANDSYETEIRTNHPGENVVIKKINDSGDAYVELPADLKDLAFSNYKVSSGKPSTLTNAQYNHALWIVENSYPTLSLDDALTKAGVDVSKLENEIKLIYGIDDDQVAKYKEMVVYSTVQYAIWKVVGNAVEGYILGNDIVHEEDNEQSWIELSKLYRYLIDPERIPPSYSSPEMWSKKITLSKPASGKELNTKLSTKDAYIYGPYSATYNALIVGDNDITYTIKNNDAGVQIVDSSLKKINTIDREQEFYISVPKKANIGSVEVNLQISRVLYFDPVGERGRVYSSATSLGQNALTGGNAEETTLSGNLKIAVNAKTGVENIALLLMVTLVAFSLGYLVLSYKQKPINLNQ